jgi:cystathionine beta-lyase/cystathionine gamma-synthase
MAGAICGCKDFYNDLWFTRQAIGTTHDAYSSSLLERGLKTFELRAARMAENGMAMAEFLHSRPAISCLSYPGLPDDSGHAVAKKQMHDGFGGMLCFDVGETQEDAKAFIQALEVVIHAVSLGATETLICIPYLTTMLYLPEDLRTSFGVHLNTVRLSAGIEPADVLVADLKQALEKI